MRRACCALLATTLFGALAGCAGAKLPLCPAIAANSFDEYNSLATINRYIEERARERSITVKILSPYAAEFSGAPWDLEWLKANYKHMLCAFNPLLERDDRSTYLSCMGHADEWIALMSSGNPERLMLTQTSFHENCSTSPYGGASGSRGRRLPMPIRAL